MPQRAIAEGHSSPSESTGQHASYLYEAGLPRMACEECHKSKEKCNMPHGQSCARCNRLGKTCRPRPRRRMGRRPIVKGFPFGSHSLVDLVPDTQRHQQGDDKRVLSYDGEQSASGTPHLFAPKSALEHSHVARAAVQLDWVSMADLSYRLEPHPSSYQQINSVLATKQGFFNAHRRFMVGRTFTDDFHAAVLRVFPYSPCVLADAYYALLGLTLTSGTDRAGDPGQLGLICGARCLRSLMDLSSSISKVENAAVIVMLGQLLLAFNAIVSLGSSCRTITRGMLWSVRSWYPALHQMKELDAITITPVLVDTVDCLIRREVPVARFPSTKRCIVDRFAGVCSSLLPLLYELCECSHRIKTMASTNQPAALGRRDTDAYSPVERQITAWTPVYPPDFFTKYTAAEVSIMVAQAHSYRLAALLIIHRLRFPLGVEDGMAHGYAASILEELSPAKVWPFEGPAGLTFDFPLLVAMVELPGLGEETFRAFQPVRVRKAQSRDILGFVSRVRQAREAEGYQGLWLDLVEDNFHGDILP